MASSSSIKVETSHHSEIVEKAAKEDRKWATENAIQIAGDSQLHPEVIAAHFWENVLRSALTVVAMIPAESREFHRQRGADGSDVRGWQDHPG